MSWVSIVSLGLCLVLVATGFLRRADIFAPHRVFGFVWSLAIGLADLKFSRFQREWSDYSWLVLLIGVCSMLLGFFIVAVLFLNEPTVSFSEQRKRIMQAAVGERRLFYTIVMLSLLYVAALLMEVLIVGYIPAFSARPDRARIEFGVFGIHLFVTTMPIILLLGTQYLVLFWNTGPAIRKSLLIALCVFVFFSFGLLLQRFGYIMWVVAAMAFVFYAAGKIKFKYIALACGVLLGFFQLLQSVRVALYVESYMYVISRMRFPRTYAVFTEPYMYIVMNLENFARSVDKWTSYSYGYFTFDFLMALTGLKHPAAKEFGLVGQPFLVSGYNTFSFFMPFYQDFGVIGMIAIPLVFGVGVGFLYHRMRRWPTLANVTMYCCCVYVLIISFFTHALGMLTTFSNMCLLVFVQYFVLRIRPGRSAEARVL